MEYGIWSLHAAGGLWADPRLARRHPILGPGVPSAAAFALSTLQRPLDRIAMPVATSGLAYRAMELVTRTRMTNDSSATPTTPVEKSAQDNESNIETRNDRGGDDENSNQTPNLPVSNGDDGAEESDLGSVSSGNEHSRHSVNNNMHGKPRDGFPCLLLDKDEAVPPVLNSWVIGAYTAMLGRLSAVTAGLEGAELPNVVSDSGSESDDSSYTEKSRGCGSPNGVSHRGYSCGSCDVVAATRPALRKHITDAHPTVSSLDGGEARRCPASGCEFTTGSRCEMETHVAAHVAQGMSPTGKKRSLALQRVRYEREEYRCSLCSYACTIEKAFQRHLRAHARGTAPETRVSCPVCGADRTSEVDLSRHMRRHRADRYFCCDICIFRTVQLKKLIQHRRMHTGEKPHLCPHCAYRSARRDNLRSHVRRVHKKENLYCDTFSPRGMLITPTSQAQVKSPASSPASTAGSAN